MQRDKKLEGLEVNLR